MKVIDEGIGEVREPVAAVLTAWDDSHILMLKQPNGDATKIYSDHSGSGSYDWVTEIKENTVLKFYYSGDRITIEV